MKIHQVKVKIKSNFCIRQHYYKLALESVALAKTAQPGNFLMVKVSAGTEPLLRRPLSIHRVDAASGTVELLYEVVGQGTDLLSQRKMTDRVEVIGPLGNGFSVKSVGRQSRFVLVAGGMGVAPLLFLAQRLKAGKVTILIGARTASQILCAAEFKKLGCDTRVATDDGSAGFHGRVTGLLEKIFLEKAQADAVVYGCGPKPMLKAMSQLCCRHNRPAQISLESHMACGIGACLGCVVQTKSGFARVCKEGPVFEVNDLTW
jgi:dihydroorotate dehydrogenase electron transfer subunit